MRILLFAFLITGCWAAMSDPCVLEPDAQAALKESRENADKKTFAEGRKAADELAAKFPQAYEIQSRRISYYRWNLPDEWPAVRDAYVKQAEQNPDNPVALTLAANALHRSNTPRAIELLNRALKGSTAYPWAALKLAEIHQSGKFEDKEKARKSFELYANACAERLSRSADWVMTKVADVKTQAGIARRLRSRLNAEKAPEPGDYELLWSLEFRGRPPAEHAELRRQVAKDVERLLAGKLDKRSVDSVLGGVKQSGASKEAVTAFEDRVLKETPSSYPAYSIAYERWKKDHKEPEDQKDVAAWEAWKTDYRAAMKQWVARFNEVTWLEDSYTSALLDAGLLTEKQAVAAVGESVRKNVIRNGPDLWTYQQGAGRLLKQGWGGAIALEWMEKAWPLAERQDRMNLDDDTMSDERRKEITEGSGYRSSMAIDYLRAIKLAGRKDPPPSLREYLEGPMPAKKSEWSNRYRALAWLASIDGHDADALTYFQQALFTREKTPQMFRGKLEDPLRDESKAAFLKTGGTEKAFALWSRPAGGAQELAEGRWEKPTKTLPSFDLSDIAGRNWKLKQLEGKSLLINLWATWCGPCRSELPHFQKLYDKTKDRSDVQVLSFNVDDELGLVEPFLKEQGYTFPALIAFGLVRGMFDGYGIPQNWIVDPKGNWIATQIGFDASDSDWENSMLTRLEAAKHGQTPIKDQRPEGATVRR